MKHLSLLVACFLCFSVSGYGQCQQADSISIHQILINTMESTLDCISGPKTKPRDFDLFSSFFTTDATICTSYTDKKTDSLVQVQITIPEYIEKNKQFFKERSFWETPLSYYFLLENPQPNTVQVEQLYKINLDELDSTHIVTYGVNLYDFIRDDGNWKINKIEYYQIPKEENIPSRFTENNINF